MQAKIEAFIRLCSALKYIICGATLGDASCRAVFLHFPQQLLPHYIASKWRYEVPIITFPISGKMCNITPQYISYVEYDKLS